MSTNVIAFELFCEVQMARLRQRNPMTFGASRRIKRNLSQLEARPTPDSARVFFNLLRKLDRNCLYE